MQSLNTKIYASEQDLHSSDLSSSLVPVDTHFGNYSIKENVLGKYDLYFTKKFGNKEEEKIAKNLTQSRAIDIVLLIEQGSLTKKVGFDIGDLAEKNSDPNYIVNFYNSKKASGEYKPTIISTTILNNNEVSAPNTLTVKFEESDLLSEIKKQNRSIIEKIVAIPNLRIARALKNEESGKWDIQVVASAGKMTFEDGVGLTFENAKNVLSEVEGLLGKKPSDVHYAPHCHHSLVTEKDISEKPISAITKMLNTQKNVQKDPFIKNPILPIGLN